MGLICIPPLTRYSEYPLPVFTKVSIHGALITPNFHSAVKRRCAKAHSSRTFACASFSSGRSTAIHFLMLDSRSRHFKAETDKSVTINCHKFWEDSRLFPDHLLLLFCVGSISTVGDFFHQGVDFPSQVCHERSTLIHATNFATLPYNVPLSRRPEA